MSTKARTVVGKGEKCLLSDPGSELRLGKEKEKRKIRETYIDHEWDEQKRRKKKESTCLDSYAHAGYEVYSLANKIIRSLHLQEKAHTRHTPRMV